MSKNFKLTYFDGKARGETTRLLFAASKTKYEDKRVSFEEWGKVKGSTPGGTLPTLEFDGKSFYQSNAINRFVAKKCGLYSKDDIEAIEIDIIIDDSTEMFNASTKILFGTEESKAAAGKTLMEETCPKYLDAMEKKLTANKAKHAKSGFFVGNTLTWADLMVFNTLEIALSQNAKLLDKHPLMKANRQNVEKNDGVKAWLDKRPKTAM